MELTAFWFGAYKLVKFGLYPLTWMVLLAGLTAVLAWLPASPGRTKWLRRTAVTAFVLPLLVAIPFVAFPLIGLLEAQYPATPVPADQRYDAIVVLSGGIRAKGTLRPAVELMDQSRHRTACGADLYAQRLAPVLLLSGGSAGVFESAPVESTAMKRWAVRLGVPESAIVTEEQSRNTYENAAGAKRLLGDASIVLVTSAAHMPRAAALFEKQGLRVTPAPCGYLAGNRPEDNWTSINVIELLPDIYALERTTIAVTETAGILLSKLSGQL